MQDDLALVRRQVEGGLELLGELVRLIDVNNVLVPRRQQQGVQVGGVGDRLPEDFVQVRGDLGGDDAGGLALAHARRADEQSVVELLVVREGGIEGLYNYTVVKSVMHQTS